MQGRSSLAATVPTVQWKKMQVYQSSIWCREEHASAQPTWCRR